MSKLSVVATPIGNLEDLSPRAARTLTQADLIIAEDTRVTMKLLNHLGIKKRLIDCHRHNEREKSAVLAQKIRDEDLNAALVTDAGTPGISDPGTYLVDAAIRMGIFVEAVAGPSALAAAVSVSGFDLTEFTFFGFLPREKADLERKLTEIARGHQGAVIHESPFRIKDFTAACVRVIPSAQMSVCCDLTKLHEKTIRGTPEEILAQLEANEKSEKGEYIIVLDMRNARVSDDDPRQDVPASLEARLVDAMVSGCSLREAREMLIEQGEKKNAVYAASLHVKSMFTEE